MDIAFLLTVSKIIAAIVFVSIGIVLLVLTIRSSSIFKALEIIDTGIHGAASGILSQGSMILATILPVFLKGQNKTNIWAQVFKFSPLAKNDKINKLIKPLTSFSESILGLYKVFK